MWIMGADLRIIEVLKDSIEVLHDYDEYFRRAVERAESSDLKRMVMDSPPLERGALGRRAARWDQEVRRTGLRGIQVASQAR